MIGGLANQGNLEGRRRRREKEKEEEEGRKRRRVKRVERE